MVSNIGKYLFYGVIALIIFKELSRQSGNIGEFTTGVSRGYYRK
jgi:hypothetical protein